MSYKTRKQGEKNMFPHARIKTRNVVRKNHRKKVSKTNLSLHPKPAVNPTPPFNNLPSRWLVLRMGVSRISFERPVDVEEASDSRNVPHNAATATYQLKQYCPAFHSRQALQIEERAWSVERAGHDEASGRPLIFVGVKEAGWTTPSLARHLISPGTLEVDLEEDGEAGKDDVEATDVLPRDCDFEHREGEVWQRWLPQW
jgi:hypothetical protein